MQISQLEKNADEDMDAEEFNQRRLDAVGFFVLYLIHLGRIDFVHLGFTHGTFADLRQSRCEFLVCALIDLDPVGESRH